MVSPRIFHRIEPTSPAKKGCSLAPRIYVAQRRPKRLWRPNPSGVRRKKRHTEPWLRKSASLPLKRNCQRFCGDFGAKGKHPFRGFSGLGGVLFRASWRFPPKIGGFPKIGVFPPKWMVKIMENPINVDDLGVVLFSETSIYPAFPWGFWS